MEYCTTELPDSVRDDCQKGNFQTRNARFRQAVCKHLNLRYISVSSAGNCFFESVSILLRDAIGIHTTAAALRADVVQCLRLCPGSTQPLAERMTVEMADELGRPLVCSTRGRLPQTDVKLDGFMPGTVQEYLDACVCEGVWVQGLHWLRAISYLHDVRVAVIIYDQLLVRFIGSGSKTIFLYKVDAETHWDPLVQPLADLVHVQSDDESESREQSVHSSPPLLSVHFTHVRHDDESKPREQSVHSSPPLLSVHVAHVRHHQQSLFPQDNNSSNGDVAPLRTHALDMVVPNSRPIRACAIKRNHHRSSSGSEVEELPEGVCFVQLCSVVHTAFMLTHTQEL
jgi:hypothetical protein